jgi:hypothetical protein
MLELLEKLNQRYEESEEQTQTDEVEIAERLPSSCCSEADNSKDEEQDVEQNHDVPPKVLVRFRAE